MVGVFNEIMNRETVLSPGELIEHPEGGRFKEVFRSVEKVRRGDGLERHALTHIYFSLRKGWRKDQESI